MGGEARTPEGRVAKGGATALRATCPATLSVGGVAGVSSGSARLVAALAGHPALPTVYSIPLAGAFPGVLRVRECWASEVLAGAVGGLRVGLWELVREGRFC